MDPPWGGDILYKKYKNQKQPVKIELRLGSFNIAYLVKILKKNAKYFILKLPFNYNYESFFNIIGYVKKKNIYRIGRRILFIFVKV